MKHKILTEEDLHYLFAGKYKRGPKFPVWAVYALIFITSLVIIFVVANFSSIYNKVEYSFRAQDRASLTNLPNITTFGNSGPTLTGTLPDMAENTVYIPKISITAPIIWNVANVPEKTTATLENGVIHLAGTALPGQIGNIFITGHSSNYIWAKGNYKTVFALLPDLVIGDQVYIKYAGTIYIYKINNKSTVKPDNLSVLKQGNDSTLSLVTCWPIGTSLYRMVLTANQIYPDPSKNTKVDNGSTPSSLPNIK
jgi:LPXTG-site transpeptidase (sortase) family protein